jgi:hypothetical protein
MQKQITGYRENKFVKVIRYILLVLLLPIVVVWMIKRIVCKRKKIRQNREKIAVFDMSQIDSMSGEEFERLLKEVFECLGYDVKLTKKSHDFGADLIADDTLELFEFSALYWIAIAEWMTGGDTRGPYNLIPKSVDFFSVCLRAPDREFRHMFR